MRPAVCWFFSLLWLGPIAWVLCLGGGYRARLLDVVILQTTWIALTCLGVALSRRLHRVVFRKEVSDVEFRTPLLVGSLYFGFVVAILSRLDNLN